MIRLAVFDFATLLTDYLREHDIKAVSAEQLRITVNLFERWYREVYAVELGLPFVTEEICGEFLCWLRDKRGNAPKTLNRKRGDLLTLWRHAAEAGWMPVPKVPKIIRFREPTRTPDGWLQDELGKLLHACDTYKPGRRVPGWDGRHDRALALVIYDTAYRFSACMALQQTELRDDGAIMATFDTQKTNEDEVKWLGVDTMAAIRALPPPLDPQDGRVFPWPFDKHAYRRRWKKILAMAGLRTTRRDGPQKMRRTSVSWLEFAKPGSAQDHLRHKTAGLARKHYIDPRIAHAYKACEVIPRIQSPL
jgi:hypothetical protein